jgi:uncharacterized membrane protein (UPF0127 family)
MDRAGFRWRGRTPASAAREDIAGALEMGHGAGEEGRAAECALDLSALGCDTLIVYRRNLLKEEQLLKPWTAGLTLAMTAGALWADPLLTYPLKVKGHALRVEVARSDEEKTVGLMFRKQLGADSGMLFVYETEGRWAMWMKNTYVPLSVAFLDRDGRILNIEDMAPLTEDSHQAVGAAKYALEVNRGWFRTRGIKPGDRVQGIGKIPGG